jgi:hypothetical protein
MCPKGCASLLPVWDIWHMKQAIFRERGHFAKIKTAFPMELNFLYFCHPNPFGDAGKMEHNNLSIM